MVSNHCLDTYIYTLVNFYCKGASRPSPSQFLSPNYFPFLAEWERNYETFQKEGVERSGGGREGEREVQFPVRQQGWLPRYRGGTEI